MPSKVNLYFDVLEIEELRQAVGRYDVIRLKCAVQFKAKEGLTEPNDAIVDTGAHTSLVPFGLWQDIIFQRLTTYSVQGISPKPECSIPVIVGKLKYVLIDKDGNASPNMEMHAYLALTDEIPLIIGFKDLLSRFKVCFDYQKRDAYIEVED